jgi:predicted AAA+ superfamily ATPase
MKREPYLQVIDDYFRTHPILAILGPRQCGKTTLARMYAEKEKLFPPENYFDLEDNTDKARLQNPKLALEQLSGLIVIDEIQRFPDLFPTLRALFLTQKPINLSPCGNEAVFQNHF